jgi:hypothetical protein
MANQFLTEDELHRMVVAATTGATVTPSSPYAEEVWQRIKREVAEIQARGGVVDLSSDLP